MGKASVCWKWPRRRVRPCWAGLARGCGPRGRHWNFREDILVGGLQFGDLTRYLVLTSGELLNGYSHVAKLSLDTPLHRGDMCLYLL
jgi:hypothetical protein